MDLVIIIGYCPRSLLFLNVSHPVGCSGMSLSPYCDVLGRQQLDKMSCSLEHNAVAFCNVEKFTKPLDAKYRVSLKSDCMTDMSRHKRDGWLFWQMRKLGAVAELVRASTGDQTFDGSSPTAANFSLRNFGNSVYPALPVSFGGDSKSRRPLLSRTGMCNCLGLHRPL